MNFSIETSEQTEAPATPRQYDGVITFKGFGERAERKHRQIIAAIGCCETRQEVNDTLTEHDAVLDALFLDWPDYAEAINEAADEHKAILDHGSDHGPDADAAAPIPATSETNVLKKTF